MFHLVTGGSGSGKSEYAEKLILESGAKEKVYIATMEVFGEESRERVRRHRRLRAGKGFRTIECPRNLWEIDLALCRQQDSRKGFPKEAFPQDKNNFQKGGAIPDGREIPGEGCAVLVECMSNLAANELFNDQAVQAALGKGFGIETFSFARELARDRILKGILGLKAQCGLLVVVTNEVFSDGLDYGPETGEYIRLLGEVNCQLAKWADRVTEVVYGILVEGKGG